MLFGRSFSVQYPSGFGQVFAGMEPVHELMAGVEMFADQVPNPGGSIPNRQAVFRFQPISLPSFSPNLASEELGSTQMGYIAVMLRTAE